MIVETDGLFAALAMRAESRLRVRVKMEMCCKYLVLERPWLLVPTGGGQSHQHNTHQSASLNKKVVTCPVSHYADTAPRVTCHARCQAGRVTLLHLALVMSRLTPGSTQYSPFIGS